MRFCICMVAFCNCLDLDLLLIHIGWIWKIKIWKNTYKYFFLIRTRFDTIDSLFHCNYNLLDVSWSRETIQLFVSRSICVIRFFCCTCACNMCDIYAAIFYHANAYTHGHFFSVYVYTFYQNPVWPPKFAECKFIYIAFLLSNHGHVHGINIILFNEKMKYEPWNCL